MIGDGREHELLRRSCSLGLGDYGAGVTCVAASWAFMNRWRRTEIDLDGLGTAYAASWAGAASSLSATAVELKRTRAEHMAGLLWVLHGGFAAAKRAWVGWD